jgi:hypothetical protein
MTKCPSILLPQSGRVSEEHHHDTTRLDFKTGTTRQRICDMRAFGVGVQPRARYVW